MIDTDKYEGCQTSRLILHKGLLCPTIFMDVDGSGEIVPTLDRGIVRVIPDTPEHYLQLLQDAPLLLAEVKRLREVMIHVEQRQPHPALEMALKQGLYLSEIRERIE
jgi:hypothetical protein